MLSLVVTLPEIIPGAAGDEQTQFPAEELIMQELQRGRLACEPCRRLRSAVAQAQAGRWGTHTQKPGQWALGEQRGT